MATSGLLEPVLGRLLARSLGTAHPALASFQYTATHEHEFRRHVQRMQMPLGRRIWITCMPSNAILHHNYAMPLTCG